MPLELFRSVVGQLELPSIVRLNYSGESLNHPWLGEAIRLARGTGAITEIVTPLTQKALADCCSFVR